MDYDAIIEKIGSFGRYQKRVYVLQTLPVAFGAIQTCLSLFILFTPDHRCSIPILKNDTYAIQNYYHETLINTSIPKTTQQGQIYEECRIYDNNVVVDQVITLGSTIHNSYNNVEFHSNNTLSHVTECSQWVYDRKDFVETFVTQSDLVCSKRFHRTHATMAYFFGFAVGSLIIGAISDGFGRKKGLMLSIILHIGSNIVLTFIQDYHVFAILRFFSGFSSAGMVQTSNVMDMELVGPDKRMIAGMIFQMFWAAGELCLAGLAFLFRDWKHLNLACSVPATLFLLYIWILPESPRWLISKGRFEDASKILHKASKINKRTYPKLEIKIPEDVKPGECKHMWTICEHRVVVIRTIIICCNWLVVNMVFNGLSLNAGNLSGNIYLNFCLTTVAEILGFGLCIPLLDKIGRKPVYVGSLVAGGVALLCTVGTVLYGSEDHQLITVMLSLIGKAGASAAFGTIFLFSSEFFPTVIRNSAIGVCAFCARIGGMLSPYVADLGSIVGGNFGRALPMSTLGVLSFIFGLLALYLPETKNRPLPETIEDLIKFERISRDRDYDIEIPINESICDIQENRNETETPLNV